MDNENIIFEFVNGSTITSRDVFSLDEYEFYFNGDHFEIKKKAAPDFGEISPSQELNDFVNTLVRGE